MVMENPYGTLTGPNLISCISELSPYDYDDFTSCTQIATHSADLVGSRFTDSAKWLDEYVVTLNFLAGLSFRTASSLARDTKSRQASQTFWFGAHKPCPIPGRGTR